MKVDEAGRRLKALEEFRGACAAVLAEAMTWTAIDGGLTMCVAAGTM